MAISYVSNALGGTATTTTFSITLPTTQADDIIVLEFTHRGTGDGTIAGTYSGGAMALKHSQLYATSAFSGKTYWGRATGNHSGQTITGSGLTNSCAAIVTVYRGAVTSGDPLADATIVGEDNASGNETQAEITTTTDGAWVVLVVANSPDLAVSTQSSTSPGTLTERAERLSTGGTDTSIAHASAEKTTAGATGALTWAQTNAISGSWAYAIKPQPTALTQASYRFYEDGTETASTAIAAQDTNITEDVSAGDQNLQLRIRLQETNGIAGAATDDYQLQYELNDSGTWLPSATTATYLFDSSDASATDPDSVWTTEANAFDSDVNSGANTTTAGSTALNFMLGEGTDAPSSGGSIVEVRARMRVQTQVGGTPTYNAAIYTDGLAELLGTVSQAVTAGFGVYTSYTTLVAPTGGWSWSTIQSLEAKVYITSPGTVNLVYAVQIEVTYLPDISGAVLGFNSASLTDGNATTNRLGAGTGSFVAGEISEDGLVDDFTHTANNYTEHLYSLTIDEAAVANNDTLDFRVLRNGATTGMTYTVTPRITISKSSGTTLVVPDSLYSVTLDNLALTQQNTLALADSLSSSTLDNVALTQANTLVVNDMLSSVTLDNTVLTTDTPLVVADSTSSSTVDNVALTQANTLAVQDSLSSVTLDNTVLTQANTLVVADSLSSVTLDNTILTTDTPLVVADSTSSSTVDNVALTQAHTLVVADSLSSTTVDNTALTQAHTLVVADSLYSSTVDNTELSQATTLVVADSLSSATLDAVTLTQQNTLALADSLFSTTVDNVALTQANTLAVADLLSSATVDNTVLETVGHVDLVVADSLSSTTIDNIVLTQANTLVVADSLSSTTVDNTVLTSDTPLVVADSTSSTTIDAVALTQANTIVVQDALSSSTLDAVALTQANTLVVADSLSSTTVDNVELTQAIALVVADSLSSVTLDAVALTQQNTLAVQDSTSSVTLDNTALTQANTLVVADSLSSTTVDNIELSTGTPLIVADSTFNATLDAVALTQANTLVVQEATLSSMVDNVLLTQANTLAVADSLSSTTVDNIDLELEIILAVADMTSSSTVDNVALTQANTLTLADMLSSVSVDNVSLLLQVDARKYYIDSNGRIFFVINQNLGLVEEI